jgi:two-component system chemotaxis sensor kinase CheA
MMIDDEELRGIFKTSSEERLQILDDGLLYLEKHPDDQDTLEALMRECHSLKGDSNMLGVADLGKLAHQMEHVLGAVKRGEQAFSADTFDRLAHGMDAMRRMAQAAVTGEAAEVQLFQVMAELMGANSPEESPRDAAAVAETNAAAADDLDLIAENSEAPDLTDHSHDLDILGDVLLGDGLLQEDPFREPPAMDAVEDDAELLLEPVSPDAAGQSAAADAAGGAPPVNGGSGPAPGDAVPPSSADHEVPEISPHFIADEEMRQIFKTSSEERLQNLDAGLLHLEKQPGDQATLESIMREAHSLKGDSNMLGVTDLGKLAHQMEHILGALKRGEETLSGDICDRLSHGMTAMKQLVYEAVTGEVAGVNVFYVLAELMGASPQKPPSSPPSGTSSPATLPPATTPGRTTPGDRPHPQPLPPPGGNGKRAQRPQAAATQTAENGNAELVTVSAGDNGTNGNATAQTSHYRIETIRVPTHNLDALMTQTGELTVTKIRVAHRLGEIEAITNLWEEWSRDLFINRFIFHEAQQGKPVFRQLEGFHNRTEHYLEQLGDLVNQLGRALYEDTTRLEMITDGLEEGIRTLRLLPLSTIFNLYPRLVRDLARQEGKQVDLVLEGGDTRADKRILEEMKDPLLHIIRNAIDHGIESPAQRQRLGKPEVATITLRGYQTPTSIVLEVSDDGKGLDLEAIKQTALRRGLYRPEELEALTPGQIQALILSPGFSTRTMVTEISGRGVGLDVLRTNVERLKGNIEVESTPGQGCTIRVQLGTTLATAHVLLVAVSDHTYALPVEFVQTACLIEPQDIFTIEGRNTIEYDGYPISVAWLSDLLELPRLKTDKRQGNSHQRLSCIILQAGTDKLGIFVDALVDEQDVVLKPQSQLLKRVRNISGATILGTGEVCMVLNPQDLILSVRHRGSLQPLTRALEESSAAALSPQQQLSILLVEDSIATRTQEKRILESAGYEVVTAVDGVDGFNKLQARPFDAVISDIQMPNLDGLGLTERIRNHREYSEVPVILVTTLASDEDRRRGAEAGANAYITKGSFNQDVLLDTLERLI